MYDIMYDVQIYFLVFDNCEDIVPQSKAGSLDFVSRASTIMKHKEIYLRSVFLTSKNRLLLAAILC